MIERVSSTRRAVLIAIDFGQDGFPESLEELKLLAQSAGMSPVATVQGKRSKPDPALYIGSGKVQEVKKSMQGHLADVAIFNHSLSPAQERNLANVLDVQVVDRTRLILDIFGRRARSHEGKLQVELAQLEHAATRLVRGWTHLERQRGGRGFLGGMGETQLEVDRRLIASRVKVLKSKLEKLKRQRSTQRRSRARTGVPSVSLVRYTNAGKSTVFNGLTHADAYAADQLFATLDTTSRRVFLEDAGPMVVSDTVGFIRELPHTLVEAFRTTLEETVRADLLLHVVDASSSTRDEQIAEVEKVLHEIGASEIPQILVWNKIDLLDAGSASAPAIDRDEYGKISRVRTSAKTGTGMGLLRQALAETAILSATSSRSGATARLPHQS
jgi:GTP-binding protein HflX